MWANGDDGGGLWPNFSLKTDKWPLFGDIRLFDDVGKQKDENVKKTTITTRTNLFFLTLKLSRLSLLSNKEGK